MKTSFLSKSTLFAVAIVVTASCNPLNKMAKEAENVQYSVTPTPLEMHGDSVDLTISGKYPPKFFPKKVTVDVTPTMKEAGENGAVVQQFKPITLVGEAAEGEGKKISFETGGSFNYNDKIAYKKNMEDVVLVLSAEAKFKSKTKELPEKVIGSGTIITPQLVESSEKPILGKDKFVKVTPRKSEVTINYLINSDVVRPQELRDEDYSAMINFLKTAKEKEYVFKKMTIEGYASPDGEISLNDRLADNRAKRASDAVMREFRKQKIKVDEKTFADLQGKGEDWEGFKTAMKASDIKDKDLIIRVLSMYDDNTKREKEIKNMAATYVEIAERILPDLRRAKIVIEADELSRTDEEILTLVKSDAKQLSIEEILYAATLTEDLNDKLDYYTKARDIYPNDWRGANNVGYVLMLQNKRNDAKAQFEAAAKVDANQTVIKNNLGAIARLEGDVAKAKQLYAEAKGAGPEVMNNMGIVNIIEGDYAKAKSNLSSENSFNTALALVLNKEEEEGLKALEKASDKEIAKAYYLKAIIGARTGNKDLMSNNLKTAIKMDATLRAKAQKDAEFIKYRNDAAFKGAF